MSEIELKVFLESKIEAVEKVLSTRMDANALALSIQTREFERRLDNLNDEHGHLAADRQHSLPRELFEQWTREFMAWRVTVDSFMSTSMGQNKGLSLSWSIFSAVISALVSAIMVWVMLKGIK